MRDILISSSFGYEVSNFEPNVQVNNQLTANSTSTNISGNSQLTSNNSNTYVSTNINFIPSSHLQFQTSSTPIIDVVIDVSSVFTGIKVNIFNLKAVIRTVSKLFNYTDSVSAEIFRYLYSHATNYTSLTEFEVFSFLESLFTNIESKSNKILTTILNDNLLHFYSFIHSAQNILFISLSSNLTNFVSFFNTEGFLPTLFSFFDDFITLSKIIIEDMLNSEIGDVILNIISELQAIINSKFNLIKTIVNYNLLFESYIDSLFDTLETLTFIIEKIKDFIFYIYFNFYKPQNYSIIETEGFLHGNSDLLLLEDGIYKINWNEYNENTLISLNLAQLQIPNVKRIDKIYYSHTPQEIVVFTEEDSYSFEPQEYFTQMPKGLRGKEMIVALYGMPQVEFINVGLIAENRSKK